MNGIFEKNDVSRASRLVDNVLKGVFAGFLYGFIPLKKAVIPKFSRDRNIYYYIIICSS